MSVATLEEKGITGPFPGLRPFEINEAKIFFGRGIQVDDMIRRLEDHRFLAVIGSSGCGKSSLVRAGLLPALSEGELYSVGENWLTVVAKPGAYPFRNLAETLINLQGPAPRSHSQHPKSQRSVELTEAVLQSGPLGLLEVLDDAGIPPNQNVLLLIDQFEEVFRFRYDEKITEGQRSATSDEANAFVSMLLATKEQTRRPIYVMLTMRSDFLGDCNAFHGLPEAINECQFLAPWMNQVQIRQAILGPLQLFYASTEPALVNRIIGDVGNDPDQLPLMQHVLMRMWNQAKQRSELKHPLATPESVVLTIEDYEQLGGVQSALSNHATEVYEALKQEVDERSIEMLFRALRQRGDKGQELRRPESIENIAATIDDEVSDSLIQEVIKVADAFRRPDCSFLMPPLSTKLTRHSLIDISHESLIRRWKQMQPWAHNEDESAEILEYLVRSASAHEHQAGELLERRNLERVSEWQARAKPTKRWCLRYATEEDLEQATRFLEASRSACESNRELEKQLNEKELIRTQRELEIVRKLAEAEKTRAELQANRTHYFARIMIGIAGLLVVSIGLAGFAIYESTQAMKNRENAEHDKKRAEEAEMIAVRDRKRAESASSDAERAEEQAVKEKNKALESKQVALKSHVFSLLSVPAETLPVVIEHMNGLTEIDEDSSLLALLEERLTAGGSEKDRVRIRLALLVLSNSPEVLYRLLSDQQLLDPRVPQDDFLHVTASIQHYVENAKVDPQALAKIKSYWGSLEEDIKIADDQTLGILKAEKSIASNYGEKFLALKQKVDELKTATDEEKNSFNKLKLQIGESRMALEKLKTDHEVLLASLSRKVNLLARFDPTNKDSWNMNGRLLFDVLTNQNAVEFQRWNWSERLEPVKDSLTASLQDIYKTARDEKSEQEKKQRENALSLLLSFGNPPTQEIAGQTDSAIGLIEGLVWIKPFTDPLSGKVINDGFYIGQFEITQRQYELIMKENPSVFKGARRPVENVSWKLANDFCEQLNKLTSFPNNLGLQKLPDGFQYRLPSIDEWENACRAGESKLLDKDQLAMVAVFEHDATEEVGSKQSNKWGLFDMLGNVEEWCLEQNAYRGGSWFNSFQNVRPDKGDTDPYWGQTRGFRVAGVRKKEKLSSFGNPPSPSEVAHAASANAAVEVVPATKAVSASKDVPGTNSVLASDVNDRVEGMVWIKPGRDLVSDAIINDGFYLAQTEITQEQFQLVMEKNPSIYKSKAGSKNRPVENVTWREANNFCKRLNQLQTYPDQLRLGKLPNGYEYALPSIAEWEYACWAGSSQQLNKDQLLNVAVFEADVTKHLSVGLKDANEWGLYDMLGNVEEWCREPNTYHGGSWFSFSTNVGSNKGGKELAQGGSTPYRGFRVAGIRKQTKQD